MTPDAVFRLLVAAREYADAARACERSVAYPEIAAYPHDHYERVRDAAANTLLLCARDVLRREGK